MAPEQSAVIIQEPSGSGLAYRFRGFLILKMVEKTMPNRFIKESCRSSKNLDKLNDFEERLFWRLITTADDYGRFQACTELVRAACFPYRSISTANINKALIGLQTHKLITLYQVEDRWYGEFVTWEKHQGKARSRNSKYPNKLDAFLQADASRCMQMQTVPDNHALVPNTDTDTNTDLNSLNSLNSSDPEFEQFWSAYPRKIGKKAAARAWAKAVDRPPRDEVIAAVDRAKKSEQWTRDDGQYIPHPATWLNEGRWADVMPERKLSLMEEFIARGENNGNGPRAVLSRVVDARRATVGQGVSGSRQSDERAADDRANPARAVF